MHRKDVQEEKRGGMHICIASPSDDEEKRLLVTPEVSLLTTPSCW